MIKERIVGINNRFKAKKGITYYDLICERDSEIVKDVAICRLNGINHELNERIEDEGEISLIGFDTDIGIKIYTRTLQFVFIKAVSELYKDAKISLEHAISRSIYGELYKDTPLDEGDIDMIKKKMQEIIDMDMPIRRVKVSKQEAVNIFSKYNMEDKIKLFENSDMEEINLCELNGRYDYFYECMAYSTGVVKLFDLKKYESGFILRRPSQNNFVTLEPFKEQKSLYKIFKETKEWLNILGIETVGNLNEKILNNNLEEVIMVSEALHEKKIANIADSINEKKDIKIVCIAGPSSSGKTTFANRLSIQLRVNGLIPVPISLDNYFVNREETPLDENGDYDYESIDALELRLLNEDLKELMMGAEVELPVYNFRTGKREWNGHKIKLPQNGVVILEGIHGLNPKLISDNLKNNVYKIYISALTQLNIDNHNRISTTDSRKVRRIVRDSLSRGYSAEDTLMRWPSVKRGEKNNIFVYQEEADVLFNSTLVYELGVLKPYVLKELNKIPKESPVYAEGRRLKAFLNFFKEITFDEVPKNSILREFIGGSCFYEY